MKYDEPRFRPTLWPGSTIVPPWLEPITGAQVHGDWLLWPPQDRRAVGSVELPPDFYLRELLDLDVDDLEAVADLVGSYGPFCAYGLTDLDDDVAERVDRRFLSPPEHDHLVGGHHREVIRVHVEAAQRAISTWTASKNEDALAALVESEVTAGSLEQASMDLDEIQTLDDLRNLLVNDRIQELERTLNAALSSFSIGTGDLAARQPTVYSVSFLQMYNHLSESATIRRCVNEPCQRHFVRQRGRAEYGQFRTEGIKYCSRECARAQAQRELRRRRKSRSR